MLKLKSTKLIYWIQNLFNFYFTHQFNNISPRHLTTVLMSKVKWQVSNINYLDVLLVSPFLPSLSEKGSYKDKSAKLCVFNLSRSCIIEILSSCTNRKGAKTFYFEMPIKISLISILFRKKLIFNYPLCRFTSGDISSTQITKILSM